MKHGMAGAWGLGVAVLTAAYGLWFVVLQSKQYFEALVYVLWLSPFVAALLCAYRAPEKRVIMGLSMAVPSALLALAVNFIYQSLGNTVDFRGVGGAVILFLSSFTYSAVLCALGAVGGKALAERLHSSARRT